MTDPKKTIITNYIKKLVKEAIENEKKSMSVKTVPSTKLNEAIKSIQDGSKKAEFKLKGGKSLKKEQVKVLSKILENRKSLIENMISEKGLMSKLGLGKFDPSAEVDNPSFGKKEIEKSLAVANKYAKEFQNKVLNNTKMINAYHDAVLNALEKFSSFSKLDASGTSDEVMRDEYEQKILAAAKQFYSVLSNEKGTIESFIKTLQNDFQEKGFDKLLTTTGVKRPGGEFTINSPEKQLDKSKMKVKNPPKDSIGKAIGDMATNWAR